MPVFLSIFVDTILVSSNVILLWVPQNLSVALVLINKSLFTLMLFDNGTLSTYTVPNSV